MLQAARQMLLDNSSRAVATSQKPHKPKSLSQKRTKKKKTMPVTLDCDHDDEVHVWLEPARRRVPTPIHQIVEEQIREVLGLPKTKATMLSIIDLDIATDMIFNFVKSRKWKSISVQFSSNPHDPSLCDLVAVANGQTASLTLSCHGENTSWTVPLRTRAVLPVLEEDECTNIQMLQFRRCLFRHEEAVALARSLRSYHGLRTLELLFCKFEEEHLQQLAESLTHPLEEIRLSLNHDDYDSDRGKNPQASLSAFVSSIPLNCCPRKLAITFRFTSGDFPLEEGPLNALGNLLSRTDCNLQDLSLCTVLDRSTHDCVFCNARGFEHFTQGLCANHSLCRLTLLVGLPISDDLAESLAEAFQQHSALRYVDVSCEKLTDVGVKRIGEALVGMPSLKCACIRHPCLSTETADFLVERMESNYSLEGFLFTAPKNCTSLELKNRQAKVDIFCFLNSAGRGAYVEQRPGSAGPSKGFELELSILEKEVNHMGLSARCARSTIMLRESAMYESVVMMAGSFAAIPK